MLNTSPSWCFGEGHGNPLQYSCLENPVDRGAWWAPVHGIAQGQTRQNQLSSSSWCLPYNTLRLVVTYQKGGRRAPEKPDSVSGLLSPVYDCLWNNPRGRNQDLITFAPHHWLLTSSPCRISPGLLIGAGGTQLFWAVSLPFSPLH